MIRLKTLLAEQGLINRKGKSENKTLSETKWKAVLYGKMPGAPESELVDVKKGFKSEEEAWNWASSQDPKGQWNVEPDVISQDVMDASPGNSDRPYNPSSNASNFEIIVNYINYGTLSPGDLISEPFHNQIMSNEFAQESINRILDDIESQNIRDDETGEYRYDITRLEDGEIKFDCSIQIDSYEIDLQVVYDENGDILKIEIQDPDLADKFGITEEMIFDYLMTSMPY